MVFFLKDVKIIRYLNIIYIMLEKSKVENKQIKLLGYDYL